MGSERSTPILKPNHTHQDYPSALINEYAAMRLAGVLKHRRDPGTSASEAIREALVCWIHAIEA
jgi:hypothetical protein